MTLKILEKMGKAETAGSLIFQSRHQSFFYCIVYFEKASDENLTSNTATIYGKQLGISRMRVLCSVATNVCREGSECPSFTFSLPYIVGEAEVEGIFESYI